MQQLFIDEKNIESVFDLKQSFLDARKEKIFFEGTHYFPQNNVHNKRSTTKKVVLWDYQFLINWIKNNSLTNNVNNIYLDEELENLLERR